MTSRQIKAKIISSTDCLSLRKQMLRPWVKTIEETIDPLDEHPDSFHVGSTFDGNEILSIGSFFKITNVKISKVSQYQLRYMATNPKYQRRGLAKEILNYGQSELKKRGVQALWCNARVEACDFYLLHNFVKLSDPFDIARIGPHILMVNNIDQ